MSTLGQMQDSIATLMSRADIGSLIQEAIRRAVRVYEREPFWFNEAEDSIVTVASQQAYTLSSSAMIASVTQIMVNSGSSRFELEKKPFEELNAMNTSGTTGEPSRWSWFNNTVVLYPVPSGAYTLSYTYMTKAVSLSATSVSNIFTTHAYDLIEQRAMWWLYATKVKNLQMAQACKVNEQEALGALRRETARKLSTGKVKPTCF